ncbi:MAG: ABC transporter substrate-binding protein [Chloroflexi bacterium]|nr:ABC transporter substrate-binding protein [Chloroflexota bacterium]
MKRILPALFFVLAMVAVLLACSRTPAPSPSAVPTSTPAPVPTATPMPAPSPTPTPVPPTPTPSLFPLTATGSNGAQVTLQKPPERIVAIDSAAVEILFALGEGRRVAGTHTFVNYPPETKDIPKIGDAFNLNFEQIAALKPDLIYIFFDRFVPELGKLGAPVLYLKSPSTFDRVAGHMEMWGDIVGRPEAGEKVAGEFRAGLQSVADRVKDVQDGPRVYVDASPMLWTLGSGSLADEVFKLLKAKNVFSDVPGARQVSAEEVVTRAPAVIVSTYEGGSDQFKNDPAFASVPAVKEGRLCEFDGALVSVPGPRLLEGITAIARCVYPDKFR